MFLLAERVLFIWGVEDSRRSRPSVVLGVRREGPWVFEGTPGRCGSAPRRRGSASIAQRPRDSGTHRGTCNSLARAWLEGAGGEWMVFVRGGEDGFALCSSNKSQIIILFKSSAVTIYIQKLLFLWLFHCLKSKLW